MLDAPAGAVRKSQSGSDTVAGKHASWSPSERQSLRCPWRRRQAPPCAGSAARRPASSAANAGPSCGAHLHSMGLLSPFAQADRRCCFSKGPLGSQVLQSTPTCDTWCHIMAYTGHKGSDCLTQQAATNKYGLCLSVTFRLAPDRGHTNRTFLLRRQRLRRCLVVVAAAAAHCRAACQSAAGRLCRRARRLRLQRRRPVTADALRSSLLKARLDDVVRHRPIACRRCSGCLDRHDPDRWV